MIFFFDEKHMKSIYAIRTHDNGDSIKYIFAFAHLSSHHFMFVYGCDSNGNMCACICERECFCALPFPFQSHCKNCFCYIGVNARNHSQDRACHQTTEKRMQKVIKQMAIFSYLIFSSSCMHAIAPAHLTRTQETLSLAAA